MKFLCGSRRETNRMSYKVTARVGDKDIHIETGRVAKQADGSVTVQMGETIVVVAAVAAGKPKPGQDFFPLTVDYREKAAAAGRFPGGYFKREGRPTEKEILTSRLTDRPIRPLFPDGLGYSSYGDVRSLGGRNTGPHDGSAREIDFGVIGMPLVPYVIEKSGREERVYDIYSRLLKDRIVFLGTNIDDEVANSIVAQILFLQSDDPKADIHLYINSPGGSVSAGLAVYDTMQFVTNDVATYCVGQAASMGAVLLTAGAKGKRFALPNARIMIHQPLAGMQGSAEDIAIHAREFRRIKERMNQILIKHTGHALQKIEEDTDRDCFMTAEEALAYRLIDRVIEHMQQDQPRTPEEK